MLTGGGRGLVLFLPIECMGGVGQKTRDSFSGVHDSLENVSGFPAISSMDKEAINPESVDMSQTQSRQEPLMRMSHIPLENLGGFALKVPSTISAPCIS